MTWTLDPARPAIGDDAMLSIVVRDRSGALATGARVTAEGHMTHPGMAPIHAAGVERAPGVYDMPLRFTMAGDWALIVTAILADGHRIQVRVDVPAVGDSGGR
jgi:hypothetical protein